jgi:hypothetical protein
VSRWADARRAIALSALVAMDTAGCGATDQVVAREIEAGPPQVEAGTPCTMSSQCGPQNVVDGGAPPLFCSKDSCSALMGTCQPRETNSDPNFAPVCDCTSGIYYWNDTLRKSRGVSASQSSQSPCPMSKTQTCSFDSDGGTCPDDAYCFQYDPSCQPLSSLRAAPGLCFALPAECPPDQTIPGLPVPLTVSFMSCKTHMCTNLCSALVQGAPISRCP